MKNRREARARAAYKRYGAVTGFKNFQGNPMPSYDELPPTIQLAWEAAATTPVLEFLDTVPGLAVQVLKLILQFKAARR